MRTCTQCGNSFAANRDDATYCSGRCRTAVWRHKRARFVEESHALLMRNAELTRSRLAGAIAGDPVAIADADRLLDEIEARTAALFGARS